MYVDVNSLQAFEKVAYQENASPTSTEVQLAPLAVSPSLCLSSLKFKYVKNLILILLTNDDLLTLSNLLCVKLGRLSLTLTEKLLHGE